MVKNLPASAGDVRDLGLIPGSGSSVSQSCLTLCDPMNSSTPGLPVHHQLLEFTQTHVHRISDAIQPSHPLLSPSKELPRSVGAQYATGASLRGVAEREPGSAAAADGVCTDGECGHGPGSLHK